MAQLRTPPPFLPLEKRLEKRLERKGTVKSGPAGLALSSIRLLAPAVRCAAQQLCQHKVRSGRAACVLSTTQWRVHVVMLVAQQWARLVVAPVALLATQWVQFVGKRPRLFSVSRL
jgi:hypothetical protein